MMSLPPIPESVVVPHGTALPPPRPGVRYVRVPFLGIVISDDRLRRDMELFFRRPMIVLALAMLPLVVIDVFFLKAPVIGQPLTWQHKAVYVSLGIIWLAFFIEFTVKIAIAESRFEYVKRNWLDLIVLAAPFLRPLTSFKIARTTKVFTLRGVAMKFLRYLITIVIGLEATERLLERFGLKAKKQRLEPRLMTRHQLMREVRDLRRRVDAWESWHEQHTEWLVAYRVEVTAFEIDAPVEVDEVVDTGTGTGTNTGSDAGSDAGTDADTDTGADLRSGTNAKRGAAPG